MKINFRISTSWNRKIYLWGNDQRGYNENNNSQCVPRKIDAGMVRHTRNCKHEPGSEENRANNLVLRNNDQTHFKEMKKEIRMNQRLWEKERIYSIENDRNNNSKIFFFEKRMK